MKRTVKIGFCLVLIVFFFFSNSYSLRAQHKVSLTAGIGIPDALNIGIRYRMQQFRTGITVGTMFQTGESLITGSAAVEYHFKGHSKYTDLRPWYGKVGLNYLRDETSARTEKFLYLNTRFGRDFNLSKRCGLDLEAGAIYLLNKTVIQKTDPNWYIPMNWKVIPSLSISFFYRL